VISRLPAALPQLSAQVAQKMTARGTLIVLLL